MTKDSAFYLRKARNSRREEKRKKRMAKHVERTKLATGQMPQPPKKESGSGGSHEKHN